MKRSNKSTLPSEERVLPSMLVSGKTAMVTGAGSGLGRSISLALAEAGADIAVTELASRLRMPAPWLTPSELWDEKPVIKLDVTSVKDIGKAVAEVVRGFSRIDILVNNAGINVPKQALDVTEDDWDRVVDVNLKGVFFCAQAVGREMVRRGSGKIVNIASQNGVVGYHDRAAHCSSKAGVVNLTRVLAIEWAPHQVNVNAVAPTFVLTPLTQKMFADPAFSREIHRRIPLGRLGNRKTSLGRWSSWQASRRFDHWPHAAGGWRLDGDLDTT
jgi:2-deoxy-D-gluconate 3-dehydrogenase